MISKFQTTYPAAVVLIQRAFFLGAILLSLSSAAHAQRYVERDDCVIQSFRNGTGDDQFQNGCGHASHTFVFFRTSKNGSYEVQTDPTHPVRSSGHDKAFYDSKGGADFASCPANATPVDGDGKRIYIKYASDYKCRLN